MKDLQLTEKSSDLISLDDPVEVLRERLDQMERENQDIRQDAESRVVQAEMKIEAMRAGMVDLDGLKFLDLTQARLEDTGGVAGGRELIGQLKRAKPWLFAVPSSSSVARVPPSRPARVKLATEMTDEEYRIARASIIKPSAF